MENRTDSPKRLIHLDMLRILAIYLVIFNHTGNRGYTLFTEELETALYFPHMLISVFCKIAVPLFFMISGALLLPKQESLGKLFSKRILRMAVVLLLISVPYYVWLHRSQGLDISSFLTYIYGNSASTALWYLYSYIALLLMLPFLRSMVKGMEEKDYLYLFAGHILLFGALPCMEYLLWGGTVTAHESFSPVLFVTPNIFYALAGYYLEHIADYRKNMRRKIGVGILLSVFALAVTCFMTNHQAVVSGGCSVEEWERFFNCFICIPAMTMYFIMKCAGEKIRNTSMLKLLPVLGGAVFGVYLIEKFARALTDPVFTFVQPIVGSLAAAIIWAFAALCLSAVIVLLLKHTPVIKKIVNRFI